MTKTAVWLQGEGRRDHYARSFEKGREAGSALSAGRHCRGVYCAMPADPATVERTDPRAGAHLDGVVCNLGCIG